MKISPTGTGSIEIGAKKIAQRGPREYYRDDPFHDTDWPGVEDKTNQMETQPEESRVTGKDLMSFGSFSDYPVSILDANNLRDATSIEVDELHQRIIIR